MEQVFELGGVNIVLHPHPPGQYIKLFRRVRRLRKVVHIRGDRYGLMTMLDEFKRGGEVVGLEGEISTFSKLDPNLPWFNVETAEDASPDDIGDIPEHLMPNHRRCQFFFDIRSHKMFFLSTSKKGGMSAGLMTKYLNELFADASLIEDFGLPRVTVLPSKESVARILGWKRIKRLKIHAERPNPGDFDPLDYQRFEEALAEQNARELNVELVADRDRYLDLNESTKALVAIGAENGHVTATGHTRSGDPDTKTTQDGKPLWERATFDPDGETFWDAFRRAARDMAQRYWN